eukprot:scaffold5046_cov122-Isochrysis_galbana.AAC.1
MSPARGFRCRRMQWQHRASPTAARPTAADLPPRVVLFLAYAILGLFCVLASPTHGSAKDVTKHHLSHSCEITQSNPSPQSGMVQPVVNEMFATVHAAGSSLLGLFTSCTTFDSTFREGGRTPNPNPNKKLGLTRPFPPTLSKGLKKNFFRRKRYTP